MIRYNPPDACLPPQLEVGASIYKEGADEVDAANEVLVLRIKSVNALVAL